MQVKRILAIEDPNKLPSSVNVLDEVSCINGYDNFKRPLQSGIQVGISR